MATPKTQYVCQYVVEPVLRLQGSCPHAHVIYEIKECEHLYFKSDLLQIRLHACRDLIGVFPKSHGNLSKLLTI